MNADILATAGQIAEATRGELVRGGRDAACTAITTDSRQVQPGEVFVALRGESFDGARFAAAAVAAGAAIVVVERKAWDSAPPHLSAAAESLQGASVVVVGDCLRALGDFAAWHRRRFPVRLVAVTGSNGKTSTKEMTAAVLGGAPAVLFNRGNFNNLVGMPRALLHLRPTHTHVVMEMGMNAPGEIARLAQIASPQVGLITNVHPVHLAGLGSIDAIGRAKGELFSMLPADGCAVVNADDPYVLKQLPRTRARSVTFGRVPSADVRVVSARHAGEHLEVELQIGGAAQAFQIARPGLHNAMNAAAAAAVGMIEGVPALSIAERIAHAPLPALRMERLQLGAGRLLIDCYNANPRSVQAALQTLAELAPGVCGCAILGDMRELGEAEQELHLQTGHSAANVGLGGLCSFGALARTLARGAREAGMSDVTETESIDDAVAWGRARIGLGATLLIKGSRAMRMERIASAIAATFGVHWQAAHGDGKE